MRMDKWLWAARFYKTRTLAADACEIGRVESNGMRAKASREVRVGDQLRVRSEAGEFALEVLVPGQVRGPAAVAQGMYRESAESREARLKAAEEQKALAKAGVVDMGRPSKKGRRDIQKWKSKIRPF